MSLAELLIKIKADITHATAGLAAVNKSMGRLDKSVTDKSARIRRTLTGVATKFAMIGTAAAAATGVLGVVLAKQAGDMESYMTTLELLYKSQEVAAEKMKWLLEFAKATPFELPGLIEATVKLKAYGIEAEEVMRTLGDTASAMGKPINQAVEALADAQTGEFERLKEFGIKGSEITKKNAAALGAAAEDIGKTALAYTDAYGKQRIKVVDRNNREVVTSTLMSIWNEKFEGAMKKQSQTINGMVSNIKDAMYQAGLAIMGFDKELGGFKPDSLFEKVKGVVSNVLASINEIDFAEVESRITGIIDTVIATIAELSPTWEGLKSIGQSIKGIIEDIFAAFAESGTDTGTFVSAINSIVTALAKVFDWIDRHPDITKLALVVISVAAAFAYVLPVIAAISSAIGSLILFVGSLATAIGGASSVMGAIGAVIALLGGPITVIIAIIAALAAAWTLNLFGIRDKTKSAIDFIKGLWERFKSFFVENKDAIVSTLLMLMSPIGLIVLAFRNWDKIKDIVGRIKDWLGTAMDTLIASAKEWGINLLNGFIDGIKSKIDNLKNTIGSVSSTVKDYIGIESPAKKGPLKDLMEWGPNLTKTFSDGIAEGIGEINTTFGNMVEPTFTKKDIPKTGRPPQSFVLNINNPVIREDQDIDALAKKIEMTLTKNTRGVAV